MKWDKDLKVYTNIALRVKVFSLLKLYVTRANYMNVENFTKKELIHLMGMELIIIKMY